MEKLYKWEVIKTKYPFKDDHDFLEAEVSLGRRGIRTRVAKSESGVLELWVPMKDAVVAKALIEREVVEVIDENVEFYHVFDDQLKFKNEALYKNRNPLGLKYASLRRYTWIGFLVLVLLLLFRFWRF